MLFTNTIICFYEVCCQFGVGIHLEDLEHWWGWQSTT